MTGEQRFSFFTGNYSRLACEIQFVRSMGYYLIQIYIPSGLIVIISWVSFWLNRNATPARVALGVTTVLTMTTLMSSTNAALPKISYVKSIDVYLGTCFVMVFASLLGKYTIAFTSSFATTQSQQSVPPSCFQTEKKQLSPRRDVIEYIMSGDCVKNSNPEVASEWLRRPQRALHFCSPNCFYLTLKLKCFTFNISSCCNTAPFWGHGIPLQCVVGSFSPDHSA